MNKEQCEQYIVDTINRNKNVLEIGNKIYTSLLVTNSGNNQSNIHTVNQDTIYDIVIINANGFICENCYNKIKDNCKSILINGESKILRNIINASNLWTLVFEIKGNMNISHYVHNSVINSAL